MATATLLLLLIPLPFLFASECQVSIWTEWSECFGDCETALLVRNRDVTVPPLPTPGHRVSFRPCPHLYEVKSCKPKKCTKEEMPTPGPFPMKEATGKKKGSTEEVGHRKTRKGKENKKTPIWRGARTFGSGEHRAIVKDELVPFTTTTQTPSSTKTTTTTSTTTQMSTTKEEQPSDVGTTTVSPTTEESQAQTGEYYINSLTLDLPIKSRLTAEAEKRLKAKLHIDKLKYRNFGDLLSSTTDPTMNEVLKQLETAAENNAPVDEKKIRTALKKNKKLVKALVEAYRVRQQTTKEVSATDGNATDAVEPKFNVETTELPETSSLTSTTVEQETTTPRFWPKKGYVPNTRKHASEITSKLYMTREIVQVLSEDPLRRSPVLNLDCLENKRCCQVKRETCGKGADPIKVKRYYRPRGSSECVSYEYPRCSQQEEMDEQPIQFIQNCQDLCFITPEKRISPLYAVSKEV